MGLAGNMKLSTLITGVACVGALGVAGTWMFWPESPEERLSDQSEIVDLVDVKVPDAAAPTKPEPEPAGPTLDPVDAELMKWVGRDLGTSKKKDVTRGSFKVNVYQDEGEATANRAKVDLDRDDKWDIKVTFGDDITRKVATADDENYDVEEVWTGEAWQPR